MLCCLPGDRWKAQHYPSQLRPLNRPDPQFFRPVEVGDLALIFDDASFITVLLTKRLSGRCE
jgi:hypothetical protein